MQLKVMSYNICSCRNIGNCDHNHQENAKIEPQTVAATLKKHSPDILGLNEVRGKGNTPLYAEQAKIIADALGMNYFFGKAIEFDGGNPYGNALLSKFPIKEARVYGIPDPEVKDEDEYYETRAIIKAVLDIEGRELVAFVSHFGLANSEKRNAVATIIKLLSEEKRPKIFMGDLNMKPDDPILKPVFSLIKDTASAGSGDMFSFASYAPEEKIDYMFASEEIKPLKAEILPEITSDHMPYFAALEF